jgi:hypothetical protein
MYLLRAGIQPGPRVTDIGPLRVNIQLKQLAIKLQRTLHVCHHETDMV